MKSSPIKRHCDNYNAHSAVNSTAVCVWCMYCG